MSVFKTGALALGSTVVGMLNQNSANNQQDENNEAALAAAQIPTRTTGIEDLLREVLSSSSETMDSSEIQNTIDELMSDETFVENMQQQVDSQQNTQQASAQNTYNTGSSSSDSTQQETSQSQGSQSTDATTSQDTTNTIVRGDAASQAALAGLVQGRDGAGAVDAMINKILREGKANISNVGTRTGSFGSTTEQLLNNDLIAKAAEAGVNQQNIMDAQQLEAIKAAQSGTATETGSQTGTQSSIVDELTEAISNANSQTSQDTREIGNQNSTSTGSTTTSENTDSSTSGQRETSQVRDTATDTSSTSNTQAETSTTDQQTAISDMLTNPNEDIAVSGALADLIATGMQNDSIAEDPEAVRQRGLDNLAASGAMGPFSDEEIAAAAGPRPEGEGTGLTSVQGMQDAAYRQRQAEQMAAATEGMTPEQRAQFMNQQAISDVFNSGGSPIEILQGLQELGAATPEMSAQVQHGQSPTPITSNPNAGAQGQHGMTPTPVASHDNSNHPHSNRLNQNNQVSGDPQPAPSNSPAPNPIQDIMHVGNPTNNPLELVNEELDNIVTGG